MHIDLEHSIGGYKRSDCLLIRYQLHLSWKTHQKRSVISKNCDFCAFIFKQVVFAVIMMNKLVSFNLRYYRSTIKILSDLTEIESITTSAADQNGIQSSQFRKNFAREMPSQLVSQIDIL